jgi:hypothetical protein
LVALVVPSLVGAALVLMLRTGERAVERVGMVVEGA